MSLERYSPRRPGDFTKLVGTVAAALDDLAEQLASAGGGPWTAADIDSETATDGHVLTADGAGGAAWEAVPAGVTDHGALTGLGDDDHTQYLQGPVASYSTAGFVVATDGTDRTIEQTGVSADSSGNLSTGGGDLTTNGGDIITGPGLVDGRDVSADGSKLDGIESGATADQTDAEILAAWESESGRDASVDGSKLDGIEAGADVTDATNVAAAGAAMDSDFTAAGLMVRLTSSGSYTTRTLGGGTGINVTNGKGTSGNPEVAVDGTVLVDGDFTANGIMVRSGSGTYTNRTLTGGTGIDVANGTGAAGNPQVSVDSTVLTDSTFGSNGLLVRTGSGSYAERTITAGDGISITNGDGVSGDPTIEVDGTQLVALTFGEAASSSAVLVPLYPHSNGGTNTWARSYRMPRAGKIVHVAIQCNVTSAGGNPRLGYIVYKTPESTGSSSAAVTGATSSAITTGPNKYHEQDHTASNTFAAGDWIGMERLRSGGFALTTEDHVGIIYVLFDGLTT